MVSIVMVVMETDIIIYLQDARHLMLPWVVVTIVMVAVDTAALIYECVISVSLHLTYLHFIPSWPGIIDLNCLA